MKTARLDTSVQAIEQAAELLRAGEVVAFPTETVYGLGASALDREAVDKIFQAKGRPADNPLIVHIGDVAQLKELVTDISPLAQLLIDALWPGPMTLILPRKEGIPDNVTAGLSTVGIRMPSHPVALELLQKSGVPVAAPSANRSGRPSPTTAEHVLEDLDGRIAAVVDGGMTGIGVESTVLDVTVQPPMILRPGGVTKEMLLEVIGEVQVDPSLLEQASAAQAQAAESFVPRAPGMKYTHYAPKGALWIIEGSLDEQSAKIQTLVDKSIKEGLKTGVLTTQERAKLYQADAVLACGTRLQPEKIAASLYETLREFDQLGIERIYSESFSEEGIGFAVMNRLRKAAGGRVVQ